MLTLKQENFCMAYIETGNASEAYRKAYNAVKMKPESINRKAKEVMDNVKVTARIKELREPVIKRHAITVDDLIRELEEARSLALVAETVQASAAISATLGKAKLLGLDISKVEITGKDGKAVEVSMTVSALSKVKQKTSEMRQIGNATVLADSK
jgi:hypothetical protein